MTEQPVPWLSLNKTRFQKVLNIKQPHGAPLIIHHGKLVDFFLAQDAKRLRGQTVLTDGNRVLGRDFADGFEKDFFAVFPEVTAEIAIRENPDQFA